MNRKSRISIALILMMLFMTTSVFANSVGVKIEYGEGEIKDIDVGCWDCWRYSDGVTWQNKKPGDWVTYTYTIKNSSKNIIGVNDVTFYNGDKSTYNESCRSKWQSYGAYNQMISKYAVQDLKITDYKYYSQGRVKLTVKARLVDNSNSGGFEITKKWQNAKVTGRRFYLPVYVNWKTQDPLNARVEKIYMDKYTGEIFNRETEDISPEELKKLLVYERPYTVEFAQTYEKDGVPYVISNVSVPKGTTSNAGDSKIIKIDHDSQIDLLGNNNSDLGPQKEIKLYFKGDYYYIKID